MHCIQWREEGREGEEGREIATVMMIPYQFTPQSGTKNGHEITTTRHYHQPNSKNWAGQHTQTSQHIVCSYTPRNTRQLTAHCRQNISDWSCSSDTRTSTLSTASPFPTNWYILACLCYMNVCACTLHKSSNWLSKPPANLPDLPTYNSPPPSLNISATQTENSI